MLVDGSFLLLFVSVLFLFDFVLFRLPNLIYFIFLALTYYQAEPQICGFLAQLKALHPNNPTGNSTLGISRPMCNFQSCRLSNLKYIYLSELLSSPSSSLLTSEGEDPPSEDSWNPREAKGGEDTTEQSLTGLDSTYLPAGEAFPPNFFSSVALLQVILTQHAACPPKDDSTKGWVGRPRSLPQRPLGGSFRLPCDEHGSQLSSTPELPQHQVCSEPGNKCRPALWAMILEGVDRNVLKKSTEKMDGLDIVRVRKAKSQGKQEQVLWTRSSPFMSAVQRIPTNDTLIQILKLISFLTSAKPWSVATPPAAQPWAHLVSCLSLLLHPSSKLSGL